MYNFQFFVTCSLFSFTHLLFSHITQCGISLHYLHINVNIYKLIYYRKWIKSNDSWNRDHIIIAFFSLNKHWMFYLTTSSVLLEEIGYWIIIENWKRELKYQKRTLFEIIIFLKLIFILSRIDTIFLSNTIAIYIYNESQDHLCIKITNIK